MRPVGFLLFKTVLRSLSRSRWSRNYFVVPEPELEPLLDITAPAPRLRNRIYLFNKYFAKMSSSFELPGQIKKLISTTSKKYFS